MLADLHNAEELKNASVKFVVEHSEEFVDQVNGKTDTEWRKKPLEDITCLFLDIKVDKFKSYPDLMALLFKAMAKSPPVKRRKL